MMLFIDEEYILIRVVHLNRSEAYIDTIVELYDQNVSRRLQIQLDYFQYHEYDPRYSWTRKLVYSDEGHVWLGGVCFREGFTITISNTHVLQGLLGEIT